MKFNDEIFQAYEKINKFVEIAQKKSVKFGEKNSFIFVENLVKYYGVKSCNLISVYI